MDGTKLFRKMRKGLGSKRNELGPQDISAIVNLYGEFEESERSKIFTTTDFFYRTITVERPLKLSFSVTQERIDAALVAKQLSKVSDDGAAAVRAALATLDTGDVWRNRAEFTRILRNALAAGPVALTGPQLKFLLGALSERDDSADVCTDAKGRPEPDADLRDTENVPWNQDIHEYFDREVKPFVPDAWIDETKTKDGCEIPFTRHFYQYVAPRSLEEIDADLDAVLGRIRARLEAVKA